MGAKSRFHKLLEDAVAHKIEELSGQIICGQCIDYPSYMSITGYIRGLTDALRLCEDIDRGLDS